MQDTPVGLFALEKTGTSPERLARRITRHPLESFIRENNPRSGSIRRVGPGDQDNVSKMGNAGGEQRRRRFSLLGPCIGFAGARLRLFCPCHGFRKRSASSVRAKIRVASTATNSIISLRSDLT